MKLRIDKPKPPTPATPSAVDGRILVVDDHPDARRSMVDILRCVGHRVDCVSSAAEALARMQNESYDVVITDLNMPGMTGLELIRHLQTRPHGAQIVMVTAFASVTTAVEAIRYGAFDYIEKPFGLEQLEDLVRRALAHGRMLDARQSLTADDDAAPAMIGGSAIMRALRAKIAQVAPTSETVLISGESGTGKELVARSVHRASRRAGVPMVSLNCPVLSAQLMESELFGHERGAFTGADAARTGRFELADGGTILLDEVTEIDLALQAKLLRVLQEKAFEKVGSSATREVDVRVLATTNRELAAEVEAGRFRRDLYYRLAVVPIELAPLRARRDDLPELIDHFLAKAAARLERPAATFDADAQALLLAYHWPGNVRELENIVTRASVLAADGVIAANDVRDWLSANDRTLQSISDAPQAAADLVPGSLSLQQMERRLIESTLDRFDGHRARTAQALGIGIRTLSGKLREYGYAPRAKSVVR
jgi:DNA-binding NtrC family response regulator